MTDTNNQFDRSVKLSSNIAKVLGRRAESALKVYREEVERIARAQFEAAQKQWARGAECHAGAHPRGARCQARAQGQVRAG